MDIREILKGDFLVLELTGRLDTKTSPLLEKKIVELLAAGTRRFVFDLKELEYVSSAGLRVLLMLAKKLSGREGHFTLCSMNESVRQVFEIAGFTSIFRIAPSVAEAIRTAPAETKVADRAAKAMGLSRGAAPDPADSAGSDLAARAAQALGIKPADASPPTSPAAAASAGKPEEKGGEKKKKWFKR